MSHATVSRRVAAGFAVLGSLLAATPAAVAGPVRPHPYFDDKGTITWHEDLASAQAEARASSKVIFIEYGRRACGNCRVLVSRLMPSPTVSCRLKATCIGLAA